MRSDARWLAEWLALMAVLLLTFQMVTVEVAFPWVVEGRSMLPALHPGDRVLVDRWTYRQRPPRAGELALFLGPDGSSMVKRVRLPPGRVVPRTLDAPRWPDGDPAEVDLVWVMGDNPTESVDSRQFGPVPRSRFRGRVFLRYWPLSRAGTIP